MSEMDDIIKEFLVESNDNLDQLDEGLVDLEKDPYSQELLGRIFLAIHTVKGTSGVLGFPKLESIAHGGENLLSKLRDGKLRLNTEITSGLLKMVDALREILGVLEASGQEGERDYGRVTQMLVEFLCAVRADHQWDQMKIVMVTTETELTQVQNALQRGADEYIMKPFTRDSVIEKLQILGLVPQAV